MSRTKRDLDYFLVQGLDSVRFWMPPGAIVVGLRLATRATEYNQNGGGTNGNNGISVDSVGAESGENEPGKPAQAHRRGSIGTREAQRRKFLHEAQAYSICSGTQEDQHGAEGTMGENSII